VPDLTGTLFRASVFCLLAGAFWAAAAAIVIHLASTRLPPRMEPARVWQDWRQKRMVWGAALVLSLVGAALTADWLVPAVVGGDLYWRAKIGEMLTIGRLGTLTGYFLTAFCLTIGSFAARRRAR